VNWRRDPRAAVPRLQHDDAVKYLVEYHFGRLSPQLNAAVEAHIRECKICQRQGLGHAATERREVARKLRKVRPNKQRLSGRARGIILFLLVIAILQIAVFELTRGAFFGSHPSAAATPTATATPTPSPLTSSLAFDAASAGTAALSLSPDGKTLATASLSGSKPVVTLWNAATGKPGTTLAWPGQSAPGVLAWSPDGKALAAADGSLIGVWVPPATTLAVMLSLPAPPALRVYDVGAGTVLQEPDLTTSFANGTLLRWSATGSLSLTTPVAGTQPPVTDSGGQQISLWRTDGSHLFSDGKSGALVGTSSAGTDKHEALLSWSPDGHFLLWASVNRSVAVPPAQSAGTPSPSATAGTAPATGIPVPNAIVGTLAGNVAQGHGDALVWFSPDGRLLAACDRTASATALDIYDIASGRIVSQLAGACAELTPAALAWQASPSAVILAVPGKPIAVYPLGATGGG